MDKIAILSDIHANLLALEGFESITDAASAAPTLRKLMGQSSKTGFFGHTHVQQVFPDPGGGLQWLDSTRIHIPDEVPCAVIVGSVGQPLHETDLRAAWVLWDPVERVVEFRKTDYDRIQSGCQPLALEPEFAQVKLSDPFHDFPQVTDIRS